MTRDPQKILQHQQRERALALGRGNDPAAVRELAEKESFVIIGRGANDFLLDNPDALRLFIYAPDSFRIPRVKEDYRIEYDSDAKKKMDHVDKERRQYFEYYTGRTWGALDHHDLMIDSSLLGIDGTVALLIDAIDRKFA